MGVQRRLIRLISPGLKIYVKYYFKKPRSWQYKGLNLTILPSVFFPHFTHSTKMLMDFVEEQDLIGSTFLELGCGTGAVSTLAAKKGAEVTASDINPSAVKNADLNAKANGVQLHAVKSDLFDKIAPHLFDCIMINPPYYPKKPQNDAEYAWFCGEDFDYFKRCFAQLHSYMHHNSFVYMILSEDCDLVKIQSLAKEMNLSFHLVKSKKKWGELTVIYQLKLQN